MTILDWATSEVERACKSYADPDDRFDSLYVDCCKSALKAMEALCNKGYSGTNIKITQSILNRLIECKPLTSIEENEEWKQVEGNLLQCKRAISLFKQIDSDGNVVYDDVDRVVFVTPTASCYSGFISKLINKMYPISLPYFPSADPYIVHGEDFLVNPENRDHDTIGVFYVITPEREKVDINRFFTYSCDKCEYVEISEDDYNNLKRDRIDNN